MTDLKLIALDEEDLRVVSTHLQDAVVTTGDMAYLPHQRRFVVIVNRFDWAAAAGKQPRTGLSRKRYLRQRTALRFERVQSAKLLRVDLQDRSRVMALLSVIFEPTAAPGGIVTLVFAGGSAIRLEVECIEAELRDLGRAWRTSSRPNHDADD